MRKGNIMQKRIIILIAVLIALFSVSLTALAEALVMNLRGGDSVEINCDGSKLALNRISNKKVKAECKGSAPAPTNTPVKPPTNTPVPQATNTPTPPPDDDLAGKECPAWVHDQFVTEGPDGNMYPTWHPQVDPQQGCFFTHEHGDDPTTSQANSSLPAFGYIGSLGGFSEPHEGFKVFVTNAGFTNDEGRTALDSTRVVAHMGTGGTGRYSQQFHSLQVDLVGRGREFHIQQMSDTGTPGSICNRAGRDFVTLGCSVQSLYEIWGFKISVGGKLGGIVSPAAFDPILVRDPNDHNRKVYTRDQFGDEYFGGEYHGCYRESYHGPFYWYNGNGPTTFRTDAFGKLDPNGALEQMVSAHDGIDYIGSADGNSTFKKKTSQCAPGLGLLN
jgi:hypothetical protein